MDLLITRGLGNIVVPQAGEIKLGVTAGLEGAVAGTRTDADPDYVVLDNGRYGDPADQFVPNWTPADTSLYKSGETFGISGTSEVGTFNTNILIAEVSDRSLLKNVCESNKVYVDTIGLLLILATGIDLTTLTEAVISVKRPDGEFAEWSASAVSYEGNLSYLSYETIEDDIDVCGAYYLQPIVTLSSGQVLYGKTCSLVVFKRFT